MAVNCLSDPQNSFSALSFGSLVLKGTAASSSTSTGTLQVRGGAGIAGNLSVGGSINSSIIASDSLVLNGTTESVSTSTGTLQVRGGTGIAGNLSVGKNIASTSIALSGTTESISTSTGALQVRGGVGIGGNLTVGGSITVPTIITPAVLGLTYRAYHIQPDMVIQYGVVSPDVFNGEQIGQGVITTTNNVNWSFGYGQFYNFAVRMKGWVSPLYTEIYRFYITGDNFASLYVDNVMIGTGVNGTASGVVDMEENQWYDIMVEWVQTSAGNQCKIEWESANQAREYIPISRLKANDAAYNPIGSTQINGCISVIQTLDSIDEYTGSITTEGGMGIAKSVNMGTNCVIKGTTQAISVTSGALQVKGGAGIVGNLHVGGVINGHLASTGGNVFARSYPDPLLSVADDIAQPLTYGHFRVNPLPEPTLEYDRPFHVTNTNSGTDITSGALIVDGGASITQILNVGSDVHIGGSLYCPNLVYESVQVVTSTTDASSTSTGALIVEGGAGMAKQLYVGDVVHCQSSLNSSGITTGSLVVSGGAGFANDVWIGGTLHAVGGIPTPFDPSAALALSNTTASVSNTTGALTVAGGVGIKGDIYVGGTIHGSGLSPDYSIPINITNTTVSSSTSSGALTVVGGVGVGGSLFAGAATFTNTTQPLSLNYDLTNKTTFAVSSSGDMTIDASGNDINFHTTDAVHVLNTTAASSLGGGAFIVSGGASVLGELYTSGLHASAIAQNNILVGGTAGRIENFVSYKIDWSDPNASKLKVITPDASKFTQIATDQAYNVSQFYSTAATTEIWGNSQKCLSTNDTNTVIYSTTNATSTSTGSLQLAGGAGIAKSLYVGGSVYSNGVALTNFNYTAPISLTSTTLATSTSTGALTVAGGVGIADGLYVNTAINSVGGYYKGMNIPNATWWRLYRIPTHNDDHINFSVINKVAGVTDLGKTDFYVSSTLGSNIVTKYEKTAPIDTRVCTFNVSNLFVGLYTEVSVDSASFGTLAGSDYWQSFTAVSGYKLKFYSLKLLGALSNDFTFRLYDGEGLGGSLLDTVNVTGWTPSQYPQWITVNTTTLITLIPTQKYTIRMTRTAGDTGWTVGDAQYSGGTNDRGSAYDYLFSVTTQVTYVDVYVQGAISDVKINSSGTTYVAANGGTGTWPTDYPAGVDLVFDSSTTKANSNDEMGALTLWNTTQSTNITTGTLVVAGGCGIAKNLYIGGDMWISGTIHGGGGGSFDPSLVLNLTNTTNSTSVSTGGLTVAGGLGISKNSYFGANTAYVWQTITIGSGSGPFDNITLPDGSFFTISNSSNAGSHLTGFTGGVDGRCITVIYSVYPSTSGNTLNLDNDAATSSAANRVITTTGGGINLNPNSIASFQMIYSGAISRWLVYNSAP